MTQISKLFLYHEKPQIYTCITYISSWIEYICHISIRSVFFYDTKKRFSLFVSQWTSLGSLVTKKI